MSFPSSSMMLMCDADVKQVAPFSIAAKRQRFRPSLTTNPFRGGEDLSNPSSNDRLMNFEQFLQSIQLAPQYRGQIAHVKRLAAREAGFADPARPLAEPLP